MKILIIRFSSIGDIVLTTPVIRTLKAQLKCEVHYATKLQFKPILETNPYIDRLHFLQDSLRELIQELKVERFDYVIDLHNNLRTRLVKWGLRSRAFSFNKLNVAKWLMVNFKVNVLPPVHIVDRYLDTVVSLGVRNDGKGLDYFIPASEEVDLQQLPPTHQSGYIAYAIGAQHATKKLPVERMIELCQKIDRPVVLLGGKEDFGAGEEVRLHFEAKPENRQTSIYNACGLYSLNQSASLLKNALFVFSHDTGLMHISAALQKKVVSIWGNTIPAFGMAPYRTAFTVLENNNLSCRPCSKIGFEKCPKGHFKCMREVRFDFEV